MQTPRELMTTAMDRAHKQRDKYAGGEDRPLAPFASYEGTAGPAEVQEEVRGTGSRKTIGELVTCPFCTSVWVATGLTAGLVFLPRATRLATATLTALAGADLLQFAHALLEKAAEG